MRDTLSTLTPKSQERRAQARRYLGHAQTFTILKVTDDAEAKPEPTDYESTRTFEPDIDNYYRFHIDYTPYFEAKWNLLRPASWLYYIDIADEVVEQKFPRDQRMRAIITAFRYSIVGNRYRIIALKRKVQALGIVALLVPAVLLALMPAWLHNPIALAALGAGALLITLIAGGYQYMRDSQLASILESNGRTLANEIQTRASDMNRHFQDFIARIDREEKSDDIASTAWTLRSAWWMKLCMWYPRRIESIETFLQSEMQRTRIFMLRTSWLGYGSAFLLLVIIPLLAAAAIAMSPGHGAPLIWTLWLAGTIASFLLTLYSLRTSIHLRDVVEAVGKEPLGTGLRFADLGLHDRLGEQIRSDKQRIRQELLHGGYGEGRKN